MMRRLWQRFLDWLAPLDPEWADEPPHDPQRITRLLWGDERMSIGGERK